MKLLVFLDVLVVDCFGYCCGYNTVFVFEKFEFGGNDFFFCNGKIGRGKVAEL